MIVTKLFNPCLLRYWIADITLFDLCWHRRWPKIVFQWPSLQHISNNLFILMGHADLFHCSCSFHINHLLDCTPSLCRGIWINERYMVKWKKWHTKKLIIILLKEPGWLFSMFFSMLSILYPVSLTSWLQQGRDVLRSYSWYLRQIARDSLPNSCPHIVLLGLNV